MAYSSTIHVFPSDLASDQQKHFMKINIFPNGGSKLSGERHTICLFIPGGGQNSPLQWVQEHGYDEVKLTKLGAGAIGAVTRLVPVVGKGLAAAAGVAVGAAAGAARIAGLGTINPKVDVLYGNTELRSFQFSFFLAPQSKKETDELQTIIKLLRKFSAPELTKLPAIVGDIPTGGYFNSPSGQVGQLESGLWFIPPAEFLVTFHTVQANQTDPSQISEQENPYFPRIGKCVLSRVEVDYTLQGEYSTFKDGAPTNVQLTLVFREMRVITQADIEGGY